MTPPETATHLCGVAGGGPLSTGQAMEDDVGTAEEFCAQAAETAVETRAERSSNRTIPGVYNQAPADLPAAYVHSIPPHSPVTFVPKPTANLPFNSPQSATLKIEIKESHHAGGFSHLQATLPVPFPARRIEQCCGRSFSVMKSRSSLLARPPLEMDR
jgi:hypothetical protein